VAIAKNLALQLLRTNIGDIELLNALRKAHNLSLSSNDDVALENELWHSIHIGLKNSKAENPMIIVDGLDDRCGHHTAVNVSGRIDALLSKHSRAKAIILARNTVHLPKERVQVFAVTPDHTHHDMEHITKHSLHDCHHYLHQSVDEQRAIVQLLTHAAKGNFLWIQLVAKALKKEATHEGFIKAVKSAKETPKSVDQLIRSLVFDVTADFTKGESADILSWLLVSERPLKVVEIRDLLRVNTQKKALVNRTTDIGGDIGNLCYPLVTIQNGIVRFRHGSIREQLLKLSTAGEKLRAFPVMQGEFVTRLLAFAKLSLAKPISSVFECPETLEVDRDTLLGYIASYWIIHFKKSSLITAKNTFDLSADFRAMFPSSVHLTLMEWSSWKSASDAAGLHHLSLQVRQAVFPEKDESVFQTLIICGHLFKRKSELDASTYFYRAASLGRSIFKGYSAVTVSCATTFLGITQTERSTTRTELVTQKEEILVYIISSYKQQYGVTSDLVIQYSKVLAEMYVNIHEEHKAETIWKELRETMITLYGKGSAEESSITGNLRVILKKGEKHAEIVEYEKSIFETVTEMEVWDVRRIQAILTLAVDCESRGELLKAEEYYVTLWRGLIGTMTTANIDIEVHISRIDISLEYVRFLRRHHRHEEAAGVLICIWAEYEEFDFESEIIWLKLKTVGDLMREVGMLAVAISVFKKCWSWFKSHGKREHTESCRSLVAETVQEVITKTTTTSTSTTTSTTTTTSQTETIVREMFESSIQKSSVTIETISISKSLISLYMKSEQWSEAITISKRSLETMWRGVVSGGGTIALPREFGSEAIEVAIQLAICHQRSHHFHEAETIYRRVYQACFNSCQVNDERFTRAHTTLIKFYEENGRWDRVIGVCKEVLVGLRKNLGHNHALTIAMLYRLGSLCSEHGHGQPHEYYEEIITVLNGNSKVCHRDALNAMKIMCKYYFEEGQWSKLKHTCEVLWETWTLHHHDHKIEAEFIELLYMRYMYVLEHHEHAEYEFLRGITIQYRDTCVKVFGAATSVSVRALIELAQISMRSEKHIHEAISNYEEIVKTTTNVSKTTTTTTLISTTVMTTIKERLTKAYVHICTHGTATSNTIERAILVLTERFEHLRATLTYSHVETLEALRELVLIYSRQKTKEARSMTVRLLSESTIAIVSKEKRSRVLYDAAKILGDVYVQCGMLEEGRILLREIHRQVVSKTFTSVDKSGFKIDQTVGKESYVFLVTFEQIIEGSASISYSEIMANLLSEAILYEAYTHYVKSEKDVEIVLSTGARLFVFLEKSGRKEQLAVIQEELLQIFVKRWGSVIKTRNETTLVFVIGLLRVLGSESHQGHVGDAACKSSKTTILALLMAGDFAKAYDVTLCAFQFIEHLGAYNHLQNVGYGFKLSALMALRDDKLAGKTVDPELRTKMLELSRRIILEVLKACKASKINFLRLKPADLNDLVGLLGAQRNYSDLEVFIPIPPPMSPIS
jgi:hypothetical protein